MKRNYLIIIVLTLIAAFVSCKKDPAVNIQRIELTKENITAGTKTVTIVGTFSYSGKIDSVSVCAADNEYLFNLETYPTVMSGKNFTTTLAGLESSTTYYYYYSVYYGASKPFETEIRNFKTIDLKLPEVITATVSFVGSDNAVCGGEVTDDGGAPVTARGVCYGQQPNPTIAETHTVDSCGLGIFVSNITGLLKNTKYYVRAYATNEKGTNYGVDMEFTTSALSPTVKTTSVTDVSENSARVSCEVVSDGGSALLERGVCYSIHQNPTLEDEHLAVGNGVGLFTANVTGLNPSTKYYIRAYAKNGSGLGFGEVLEFTTVNIVTYPAVSTVEIKNVTALNATAVGNVSSDGGAAITTRGFCWSKTANPTIQNSHVEVSGTTGVFESSLSGLEANTTYHVRAYAVNSKGAGYGEELTFTTTEGLPVVVTSSVTEITATSAKCGGNVTDQGASNVTERGICWSTNHNPTIADSHASGGSGAGTYTCSMTGLTPNATYYVRAYAKNTQGISYGTEVNFVALEGLPTVTTNAVTNITTTTATGGGNVTSQGGSNVTERGICWSTSHNPTMSNSHASGGSGTGSFTAQMTGLTPGTKYYVRAYAKNTQGVTYGIEVEFTTTATMPTVTTGSVSEITQTTATGGGNITSDGGSSVTERGICWSTDANPTIEMSHIASGSGTGNFSAGMTGLTAGTTYHVRAYATNGAGTAYGNDVTFTTTATLPTVTTAQVSNITQTTAVGGGNVTSDGGANVTERGVCWSLNADPTTSDSHATSGTGTGGFTANMTGLTANTTYHVRAYAKNSQGTSYGSDVTFTTSQSISAPTVTTSAVTTITQTTAVGGGNVTADGGANVTERGICWGTLQNPTTSGTHSNSGTGIGDFTVQMSGLTANTTYYVRAYAVNSAGTSYGNEVSFTTLVDLPVVTTSTVSNITQTTATGGGNVTSDGGATVTARGVCWSTSSNPTTSNSHTTNGSGTGTFTSSITGLSANTTYYVRAYATNSAGTAYGNDVTFTTTATLPTVTTSQVSNITQTTAQGGGNVTSDGGANVTERGVCWSLNADPTTSDSHATSGTGTGGFTANMTGLTANTTYHVRAYAKNSQGTSYGSDVTFTTSQSISAPTVTTSAVTTITQTTAVGGGNVTGDGGANVTERGICWGTSQNPTTNGTHSSSGSGTGSFTVQMSGLTSNTTYYVRAYATNSAGTSYGEQKSFTTLQNIVVPTVTTNNVTDITQTTATCGGSVTSDGGATVTARGVCWSTSSNPTTSNSHTTNGSGTGTFTSSITGLSANTTYYVRAYATNSAGTSYGDQKSFTTYSGGGGTHAYVDLGLPSGLLWATCNIGATNPEDYGDYFAWGEIEPYYADGHSQDNPCSNWRNMTTGAGNTNITGYDWHTYSQGGSNNFVEWATPPYNTSNVLKQERDAAHVNWGDDWRMPTKEEWQELYNNTTSTWTTQNGVYGRRFTSTVAGHTGMSLFLPAAGYRYGSSLGDAGSYGNFWSSSLNASNPDYACSVYFSSDCVYPQHNDLRYVGFSVRPVR